MDNKEFKERFIEYLFESQSFIKRVNQSEFRTRCPFCGDSIDPHKGHLYIHIDMDSNTPMVYHCFKCESGGVINKDVLEAFDGMPDELVSGISSFNSSTDKVDSKGIYRNNDDDYIFDFKLPEVVRNDKIAYIENRLGLSFSDDDIKDMKIITSIYDFLRLNEITTSPYNKAMLNMIEERCVGFLSYGSSHILFRNIDNKPFGNIGNWIKYPIVKESQYNKLFYSIATEIDIFTKDNITINMSEGIFDILSIYYNFYKGDKNTINVAVTGKYYITVLRKLMSMGILGTNVNINIYADNDKEFNKKAKNPTTFEYFKKEFETDKYLYNNINIYYNTISKDCGVKKEEISLERKILK